MYMFHCIRKKKKRTQFEHQSQAFHDNICTNMLVFSLTTEREVRSIWIKTVVVLTLGTVYSVFECQPVPSLVTVVSFGLFLDRSHQFHQASCTKPSASKIKVVRTVVEVMVPSMQHSVSVPLNRVTLLTVLPYAAVLSLIPQVP